jgi:DNA-binding LytR/AlgR family response regulator
MSSPPRLDVLVVDDELPPLEDLRRILEAHPTIATVDTVTSAPEAIRRIADRAYDAIFLDVRMPGMDGLELGRVLGSLNRPPALVFVSAFEAPAVTAFELRAVDYLLKPVTPERVAEAIDRVVGMKPRALVGAAPAAPISQGDPQIVMVENIVGGTVRLIPRSSILYIEARGDYVRVTADDGRFFLRDPLAEVEQRLGPYGFQRVHRGYVANLHRAVEIRTLPNGTGELVLDTGDKVPIARRQLPELRHRLRR